MRGKRVEIKEYINYKETEILRLYNEVGWTAYTEKPQVLEQGYKNSLLVLAAYENDELITDNTPKTIAFYKSLGFSEFSEIGFLKYPGLIMHFME